MGGEAELLTLLEGDRLQEWLKDHEYDLIVVGGGSGGLAAAKEAARLLLASSELPKVQEIVYKDC